MELIPTSLSFYLAVIASFLCVFLYHYFTSTYSYWKDRNVPYIKPVPIFGNIADRVLCRKPLVLMYQEMYDRLGPHKYGGFFQLKTPTILIRDPETVERVLVKDFKHFYDRGFKVKEDDPIMANLFLLGGETWRNLRVKMTPTFTTGKLKGMFDQISACGDGLVNYVEQETNLGKPIQTNNIVSAFSLDVIASCAFGLQMDKDDKINIRIRKMFNDILNPHRGKVFIRTLLTIWPALNKILNINAVSKELAQLLMSIVKDTADYREKNNIKRNDFLQLMLNIRKQEQSGKPISIDEDFHQEDEVIDQMKHASVGVERMIQEKQKATMTDAVIAAQTFVFLIAGSETVASTISFTLFCLSQNPDVQEKVQKEIDAAMKNSKNQWSYQVVKEMDYLEQAIQETLRMYPATSEVIRSCTEPYKLPGSEAVIDVGTKLVIPIYSIHNDPQNYENPQVFDPDRFLNNNFKPSGSYLPFGNGPRICIGMRFAILEVKVVLARLLSQFTVKLNDKTLFPPQFKITSTATVQIEGGFWFDFVKRE